MRNIVKTTKINAENMSRKGAVQSLHQAKKAKSDEFYTLFHDIQKEVEAYYEYNPDVFKGKVVYCNCDDPYKSNFFRYFVSNFNKLGLKQLITTSYKPSPIANTQLTLFDDDEKPTEAKGRKNATAIKFIINDIGDINDGFGLRDVAKRLKDNKNNEWEPLKGDGDFRSHESKELLKQCDIVVTNPPFSLFREYISQIIESQKKFLIIANINAITYKEVFPLIKNNKIWLGTGMGRWISGFIVPESYELYGTEARIDGDGNRVISSNNCLWFTNLDHGKRHQEMSLMTMAENLRFSSHKQIKENKYPRYDNFEAIEVPFTDAIPSDYEGIMGVPITFLDKYNPDQFEIVGCSYDYGRPEGWAESINMSVSIQGVNVYKRILIKHKTKKGVA